MTDSVGFCHFSAGGTGNLLKRTIEADKEGYQHFELTLEYDDGFVTYRQKLDTTRVPENSFAAIHDTLVVYLRRK